MPSVAMMPGATQFRRIFKGAHSIARVCERHITAALAAQECATPGIPRVTTAVMLTTEPVRPASRQRLPAAWVMYQVPFRLVSMTAFQPLWLKSMAACGNWPPALFTSMSKPPK